MTFAPQRYDGRKCFAPCPNGQPCHCRDADRTFMVDTTPHAGGSLNTTPPLFSPVSRVSADKPLLNLDDDTPIACPLRKPGDDDTTICEACQ